jgi:hypothetical protein
LVFIQPFSSVLTLNLVDSQPCRTKALTHKGIAVNEWRGRIRNQARINEADLCCPVCVCGIRESVLHRFWECRSAKLIWSWGVHILHLLTHNDPPPAARSQRSPASDSDSVDDGGNDGRNSANLPITWKHSSFNYRMPRRYKKVTVKPR